MLKPAAHESPLVSLFALAPDEGRVEAEVNLLHHQVLLRYRGQPL